MKVRWNACYASSNVLKKDDVSEEMGKWVSDLVSSLSSLVLNFQNFKVRINAAVALGAVKNRAAVNSSLFNIMESLVVGLESSQNLEVFGEYQHQSNLVQQLCLTLSHLITFTTEKEFTRLKDLLYVNWDIVENSYMSAARNIAPNKFTPILAAHNHISAFSPRNEEESSVQAMFQACVENTR